MTRAYQLKAIKQTWKMDKKNKYDDCGNKKKTESIERLMSTCLILTWT